MKKKNKEFSNIKLLSELPFFEKRKNFTVKYLLREQAFYKQPNKKTKKKKINKSTVVTCTSFS